jgi:hypothetical protein
MKRIFAAILIALILLTTLPSSSSAGIKLPEDISAEVLDGHKYPQVTLDNYMKGCAPNNDAPREQFCLCLFNGLQARYTYREFLAVEQTGNIAKAFGFKAAVRDCNANSIDLNTHNYPQNEIDLFVASCNPTGDIAQGSRCNCIIETIQRSQTLGEYRAMVQQYHQTGVLTQRDQEVIDYCSG